MTNQEHTPPPGLSLVERAYLEGIHKMGPLGRVRRTCDLYASITRMLRHQIELQHPGLSERDVRIKVAERIYAGEPETLKLLERAKKL